MKLIATVLALTCTLLLTGCVNRDTQNTPNNGQNVVTDDNMGTNDRNDVPDPAGDAEYEADGNGAVEPDNLPDNNGTNGTDNDRDDHNDGGVMDNMAQAADDVGDAARDMVDDVADGVDNAVNGNQNNTNANR